MSEFKWQAILADVTGIPTTSSGAGSTFLPHGKTCNVLFGDRSAKAIPASGALGKLVHKIAVESGSSPPMALFLSGDKTRPGLWEMFDEAN